MARKMTRTNVLSATARPSLVEAVAKAAAQTGRSIAGFLRYAAAQEAVRAGIPVKPEDISAPEAEKEAEKESS